MRTCLAGLIAGILAFGTISPAAAQELSLFDEGQELAEPSILPWVVSGVGVAAILLGAVFALLASGQYSDAEEATTGEEAADATSSGDTFATTGNVMFILGGSLLLTGVAWLGAEIKTGARFGIGPGSVSLSGSFD
ncbi:MAG: hypothetical protein AAGF12_20105 [Myxococcota bacterium]